MSETAKKARAAMKAKAQRLGGDRPLEKVDSSTWVPPKMENAGVKTGLRPVSRRQFKKGGKVIGKVAGEETAQRADRKPRQSGGKAITANSLINKNVKEANEKRDGIKHVGGMKKGGAAHRKHRDDGGSATSSQPNPITEFLNKDNTPNPTPASRQPSDNVPDVTPAQARRMRTEGSMTPQNRKAGGRAKKMDGGSMGAMMGPVGGANAMMQRAAGVAGVPNSLMGFNRGSSRLSRAAGLKKGGKAEGHPDEAADKALIKKMVKSSARTGKASGGKLQTETVQHPVGQRPKGIGWALKNAGEQTGKDYSVWQRQYKTVPTPSFDKSDNDQIGRTGRATGGQVFSGSSYPGKIPGVVPGGRTAHATGGKTKGKTDINIVINAEKGGQPGMMPPGGMPPGGPPKGMPVAVPPPPGGMPPGMMPGMMPPGMMMPPGGAPPMAPPGAPPMGRKTGGRAYRSYMDMDAGAGSGEGRLEKTEMAKRKSGIQKA